ncbi:MFS transporter [Phenylobacterium sp.]|uniref:MFS transporter n=1 Tax=Phenylobacterium sp. TaxID=1871053 RepID=UPI002C89C1CA|nr:MFS transporter [Phenylobacterium sp.]HLZ75401.1 MFS transporter [Phenylobacterium sp.]
MSLSVAPPPLPTSIKITYGVGSVAMGVVLAVLSASVVQLYFSRVLGVPAIWVGSAFLISMVADAVIDPLIGQWTDNHRSRLGRRHPFMYAAALPAGLFFYILWHVPGSLGAGAVFAFSIALMLGVRLSLSLYEVPSNALAPELAPDYDQRTSLFAWRWFFLVFATAAMEFILYDVFLAKGPANPTGVMNRARYAEFGTLGAAVMIVCILVSSAATHNRIPYLHQPPKRQVTFAVTTKEIFGAVLNPALLSVIIANILGGASFGMQTGLSTYFYFDLWRLSPQNVAYLAPGGLIASMLGVFAAPALSRRFGKKTTMMFLFTVTLLVQLTPISLRLLGLMPPDGTPALFAALFASVLLTYLLALMGLVVLSSMVADVVEDQAVKSGTRSEGVVFATNGLVPKITAGLGAFLAGVMLTLVHYPLGAAPGTVPWEDVRRLAMLYLPLLALLTGSSIWALSFYKIDRATHEANLDRLREVAALATIQEPPL